MGLVIRGQNTDGLVGTEALACGSVTVSRQTVPTLNQIIFTVCARESTSGGQREGVAKCARQRMFPQCPSGLPFSGPSPGDLAEVPPCSNLVHLRGQVTPNA